jgi:hypothetical protein
MYWFAVLAPSGNVMPSMVFNAERLPLGFMFFTAKEKLDEYMGRQTRLPYVAHELEKTIKVEEYLMMVIKHFAEILNDEEKASVVAMMGTPVFVDPVKVLMEDDETPTHQSLYTFIAENFKGAVDRNVKTAGLQNYKGYTIVTAMFATDNTFASAIKKGTFKTAEEMQDAKVDDHDYFMTQFYEKQAEAEAAGREWVDNIVAMGKENPADGEAVVRAKPDDVPSV